MDLLRILLADDHEMFRRTLRSLVESHANWQVCGEASDGREAIEKARELTPDVVILDINMPRLNGIEAVRAIHKELPQSKILIVSQHSPAILAVKCAAAGALGFVSKSRAVRDLFPAVEAISHDFPFWAETPAGPRSASSRGSLKPDDIYSISAFLPIILEATRTLLADPRLDAVLPSLLRLARQFVPSDAQAVWRFHSAENRWTVLRAEGFSGEYGTEVPVGLSTTDEMIVPDLDSLPPALTSRRANFEAEGIRSLIAVPMRLREGVGGTLVFYFRQPHTPSQIELQVISTLSNLAALAIDAAELHESQDRGSLRSKFLAEASAILASSLEYEHTLASVAKIAVPQIADWCAIDVQGEDGRLRRVTLEHLDPEKLGMAGEIARRFPPNADEGALRVFRTGQPSVQQEVTEAMLRERVKNPEHLDLLLKLGIRSVLMVPLIARARTLGVITLVMAESGRHFDNSDLEFVQDLARHAALAVDNSRLHSVLRTREKDLEEAQHLARMGSWQWNPESGKLLWSSGLYEIAGRDPRHPAVAYPDTGRLFTPTSWSLLQAATQRMLESGEPYTLDLQMARADGELRWVTAHGEAERDSSGEVVQILGTVQDITERKRGEEELQMARERLEERVRERTAELQVAEQSLRALTGRLFQIQDEERRRIARELHDSAGQIVTALNMNLVPLERKLVKAAPDLVKPVSESVHLVDELSRQLRTISHLLHPPLLDELGLHAAVRWYVDGFAERSKIPVQLEIPAEMDRFSRELETTIFRLVQECLTNIHRHSGSPSAAVHIACNRREVRVEVRDRGKGMPLSAEGPGPARPGVGIQGMRERVRQLGGRLQIESSSSGTAVIATLPAKPMDAPQKELETAAARLAGRNVTA